MIPQIVQYEMRKNQQKNLMTRFNTDMQKKLMVLDLSINSAMVKMCVLILKTAFFMLVTVMPLENG